MAEDNNNENPNETLAEVVAEKLLENNLIAADRQAEILKALKTGSARQEDWKLWLATSAPQEEAQDES